MATTQVSSSDLRDSIERESTINQDREGNPLGISIFLSTEELQKLGVDTAGDTVSYRVENGQLSFSSR